MRLGRTLLCALLAVAGCGDEDEEPANRPSPSAPANPTAKCEHGVLTSLCPKCNPRLAPVYQARGDWCAEHGLPESFCPMCRPEAGGRPAVDVAADEAPADGTRVRFKHQDVARQAGLATAKAEAISGGAGIQAVGTITYDGTRRAEIQAPVVGVVRTLKADVGAKVGSGAALAIIESASAGSDRSRLDAADAHLVAAEATYLREKGLLDQGIAAAKEVLAAKREWDSAKAEQAAARAAVAIVGRGGAGRYAVTSPIAGVVRRRRATLGHVVAPDQILFEVVDTAVMWAELDVAEADLGGLRVGQPVSLTVDTIHERRFSGTVATVASEIDSGTRTAKARVVLANPDGMLRANMFVRAEVAASASAASRVLVPRAAVQRAGRSGAQVVFVKRAVDEFEVRRVRPGPVVGDKREITSGLAPGEEVVTTGSFLLKTEVLKDQIGAGCCDVE